MSEPRGWSAKLQTRSPLPQHGGRVAGHASRSMAPAASGRKCEPDGDRARGQLVPAALLVVRVLVAGVRKAPAVTLRPGAQPGVAPSCEPSWKDGRRHDPCGGSPRATARRRSGPAKAARQPLPQRGAEEACHDSRRESLLSNPSRVTRDPRIVVFGSAGPGSRGWRPAVGSRAPGRRPVDGGDEGLCRPSFQVAAMAAPHELDRGARAAPRGRRGPGPLDRGRAWAGLAP